MKFLLVFSVAVPLALQLYRTEGVVFKQNMFIKKRIKEAPNTTEAPGREPYDKHLDENCEEDGQCSYYATWAHCSTNGDVSVCSCMDGFAKDNTHESTCVPETLEITGYMPLKDEPWEDDMLVEGSEAFNRTTAIVANVLLVLDEVVKIEDMYIMKNISFPVVHYDILVYNPEASNQLSRQRRWALDNHKVGKNQDSIEVLVYKMNEVAYLQGANVDEISAKLISRGLKSFCFDDSDCIIEGSLCTDSACSCKNGAANMMGAQPRCL